MKRFTLAFFSLVFSFTLLSPATLLQADETRFLVVIEESYYAVKPESEEKFLEIYKTRVFPFWKEMNKMGLVDGDIRMYSQRIHTLKPRWTFKTVVRFKNYSAIDMWLEKREEVFDKLFPGEGGYRKLGKKIREISDEHWDEFIREIPLG